MDKRILTVVLLSLMMALDPARLPAKDLSAHSDLLDMSLEDLMKVDIDSVYGASGYKQKISQVPSSITIITADEIRRYGYRTLADVLRNVPGFYVSYDRQYDYLGIRGFSRPGDYNSRILLLVDGHRINDNLTDQAYIGTDFPLDIDLIDRVEVIRGPNSSRYVASALLAVVNVVTERTSHAPAWTVSSELASYGTYKGRLSYSRTFSNGLGMLLSGTYYNSHGQDSLYFPEYNSPLSNFGVAQNADYDRYSQVFARFDFGHFRLEGLYGSRDKGTPTGAFMSVLNDRTNATIDTREFLDLQYDRNFGSDWGMRGRVDYDRYPTGNNLVYDLSAFDGPSRALAKVTGLGEWWEAEYAVSKKLRHGQTLVWGGEFRDNFHQSLNDYFVQPFIPIGNVQKSSTIGAVYAQDEIRLGRDLDLDLGLRYDHYSTFGGTTNPRAALIWHPLERSAVKFLYGQSFRAPNFYELYFQSTNPFLQAMIPSGNPNLKPETARTTEVVFEQNLDHQLHLIVAGYYYPIRGLINAVTDPATGAFAYQNSEHVNMRGSEITLERQSRSGFDAGVSYSLVNAYDLRNGGTLTASPHTLGQANLSAPLFRRRLYASGNVNYVSRRKTLQGNLAGAYAIPNFTLLSHAIAHWEISASLYNAFNQRYSDPGGPELLEDLILQDGRTFRLKFMYHF